MLKHCTLVGLLLLVANTSFATMTLVTYPTNYFTTVAATSTTTAPTIYAGMTSSNGQCQGALCDSCAGMNADFTLTTAVTNTVPSSGQYTTCSVKEIHPADLFTITVSSNYSGGVPNAPLYIQSGSTGTPTQITGGPLFNGSSATFSIPWSQICSALGNDANCTTSFPSTALNIGWGQAGAALTEYVTIQFAFRYVAQSPNWTDWCSPSFTGPYQTDEGFCYFTAYPGDSKAYIFPTANTASGYVVPDMECPANVCDGSTGDPSAMTYAGVAVFYLPGNSTTPNLFTTASPHQTMTFQTTTSGTATGGSLSPKYISGLSNGTQYNMAIASIDQAGILTFFSNPAVESFSATVVPPDGNSQAAIPEPVEGLLNGQSCFIATAAYGSVMAPEVETFRQFRGKFLLKSAAGRWFVRTYYKFSPPLADFIAHNELLRFLARLLLLPLLAFVKMSLSFGLAPTFFTLVLAAFLFLVYRGWSRKAQELTGDGQ